MRYFPIFVDLADRQVLVVGGGEQVVQKVRLLMKTPARIRVVATGFAPELLALAAQGRIVLIRREFEEGDTEGAALIYAAAGEVRLNLAVAALARARAIPVNVVDEPEHCSFITPAIVDRGPVVIAIGTEGAAPVIAREIKAKLEAMLPARFGRIAAFAQDLRQHVAAAIPDGQGRRLFWERLFKGPFRAAALAGDGAEARAVADAEIATFHSGVRRQGRVVLIGCGPGDADLLTLKAQQHLQEADVLVIDRLVSAEVLDYARRDAERIYVGKTPGGPSAGQSEINAILVREAAAGKIVARLKGGDPFVFGRAAEELAALAEAGIATEVVPGITAAHACAARIGLPITLRSKVRRFSVITGATADGELDHDWHALAGEGHGFAVYMGVASAPLLRSKLIAAGGAPDLPVVVVENGTLPEERAYETTLGELDALVATERLKGPAIIFVGLDWRSAGLTRPLSVKLFRSVGSREEPHWTPTAVAEATHWVMG